MEDIHVRVLEKGLTVLRENLDPNTIIPFLVSKRVLKLNDSEKIQAKDTREEKIEYLISILPTRGVNAYSYLMQSLEQDEFNIHLTEKLHQLETAERRTKDMTDSCDMVQAQEGTTKEMFTIPSDIESDDEDTTDDEAFKLTFKGFLKLIGLEGQYPGRLTLKTFVQVLDPKTLNAQNNFIELFWQKLSSLDYRARSKAFLKHNKIFASKQPSMKDFVFSILQCSNTSLRQDILEKMSACQLAVPIVLQGVEEGKPKFLSWSLRRIVKKWKDEWSVVHEKHIVKEPLLTVSFLRIGQLKGISKSEILNYLLGPCQGNRSHSYFVTKEDDLSSPKFSSGCIESVWYLPSNSNGLEQIKWAMTVLNLRGDSAHFPFENSFLCKSSNLTVAFIAKRNIRAKDYTTVIDKINSTSRRCKFIVIDEERDQAVEKPRKMKSVDNCLYVRSYEKEELCEKIYAMIETCYKECLKNEYVSLDQVEKFCKPHFEVEVNDEVSQEAKRYATQICNPEAITDIPSYKRTSFPLQIMGKEWVAIDRQSQQPDMEKEISVEFAREKIKNKKDNIRKQQLKVGFSDTMEIFQTAIDKGQSNFKFLDYFMSYFDEELFCLTYNHTKRNLQAIETLEQKIENFDKISRPSKAVTPSRNDETHVNENDRREELLLKKEIKECQALCKSESEKCKENTLSHDHFLRELAQFFEAHLELNSARNTTVDSIPTLAVKLLINGYPLEIMDGDTGSIPLLWLTSVLRLLASELKNPSIIVLSVVGVQSSGKSTLLNTLFGVKFPVRAGRCTRGLFLHMLKVDDSYAKRLGAQYIFLIDSEGISSLERAERFDNELVTLALCISDITILNIEGEVISKEMAGILEIAAHALIRMKQVKLYSQCRIIQQRVSEVTAKDGNKPNMDQIIQLLNNATVAAAKAEGFKNTYRKFADVFDLRLDKDLQFLPCLYSRPMSPPNESYGEYALKLQVDMLGDFEKKRIIPQFTVLTFITRIRDMSSEVKNEKFLFKFQDSVKAVDFNNLCMELNKWITDIRLAVLNKQVDWQRRLLDEKIGNVDDTFESVREECNIEVENQKTKTGERFDKYVDNHERKGSLEVYGSWFKRTLELAISDVKHYTLSVLKNDVTTLKLQKGILSSGANIRANLREHIKRLAEYFNEETLKGRRPSEDTEKAFDSNWDKWMQEMQQEPSFPKLSESTMEAVCESLLHSITKEMSVYTEISMLSSEEGGIKNHAKANEDWRKYFPDKGGSLDVKDWFRNNENKINSVVKNSLEEQKEKNFQKGFDANLFQYLLQNALQELSPPYLTSEAPCRLKAKILLNICGQLFTDALQYQRAFEAEHSLNRLFNKEKEVLRTYFNALLRSKTQVDHAVKCLTRHLSKSGKDVTLRYMRDNLMKKLINSNGWGNKFILNETILRDLCLQEDLAAYRCYIDSQVQYIQRWIKDKAVAICCENTNGHSFIQELANITIQALTRDLDLIIDQTFSKVKNTFDKYSDENTLYKSWVNCFIQNLQNRQIVTNSHELWNELLSFHISNLDTFLQGLKGKLRSSWKDNVLKEIKLPTDTSPKEMKIFLERQMFYNISANVLLGKCLEQCPLCKVACENPLPIGPFHIHVSSTHLPRGLTGITNQNFELLIDDCPACVSSPIASYVIPGTNETRLCRDYRKDFPTWSIEPQNTAANYSFYWKWVMNKFNKSLASIYQCEPAKLPTRWTNISKQDALDSLMSSRERLSLQIGGTIDITTSFLLTKSNP